MIGAGVGRAKSNDCSILVKIAIFSQKKRLLSKDKRRFFNEVAPAGLMKE